MVSCAIHNITRKNTNNTNPVNAPRPNLNRNVNSSSKTASPNAVNKLKELMKN